MGRNIIRITENDLHNIVKHVLNEISDEMLARAFASANADYNDLNSGEGALAKNKVGRDVHRSTQKNRRDRQKDLFNKTLSQQVSRKLRDDVRFGGGDASNGSTPYYWTEIGGKGYSPLTYRRVSNVDAYEPTDVYNNEREINQSKLKGINHVRNLADIMAGYHDELTNGKYSQGRIDRLNDRINDIENNNKYHQDLDDYEKRKTELEDAISAYERLPWYKKPFKTKPEKFTEPKPEPQDMKTGPYFLPRNPEGTAKEVEATKARRDAHRAAYRKSLERGK